MNKSVVITAATLAFGLVSSTSATPKYTNAGADLCTFRPELEMSIERGLVSWSPYPEPLFCAYQSLPDSFGPPDVSFVVVRASASGGTSPDDETTARLCFRDRFSLALGIECGSPEGTFSPDTVDLIVSLDSNGTWTREDLVTVVVQLARIGAAQNHPPTLNSFQLETH